MTDSVTTIASGAFLKCKALTDQAFEGCSKKLTFYGVKNSYVSAYAADNKFNYKKLALTRTKATLSPGDTLQLKLNSLGRSSWKSSNKKIAAVSSTGKITAKCKGTATITAFLYGKKYKCTVTVK